MLALDLRILLALLTTSSRFVSLRGCSPACVVVLFFIDICDFLLIADASGCGLEVVLNVSKLTYILYHSLKVRIDPHKIKNMVEFLQISSVEIRQKCSSQF